MPSPRAYHRFELVSLLHPRHAAAAAFPGVTCLNRDLHLIHVLQGRGVMRVGSRRLALAPGRAFLVPLLTPYACGKHAGCPLEMVNFHYHLHVGAGLPALGVWDMPASFAIPNPRQTAARLRQWAEQWATRDPAVCGQIAAQVHQLVMDYFATLGKPRPSPPPTDDRMDRLLALIDLQSSAPYDSRTLARLIHLSVSQMNRRFRAAYGIPPRWLHERRRLARIQEQLQQHPDLPMKEVADRFGFHDSFYFCRWFRKHCGVPPTEFRRRTHAH